MRGLGRRRGAALTAALVTAMAAALLPPGCAAAPSDAGAHAAVPAAEIEAYRPAAEALVREALVGGRAFTSLESLVEVAPHRLSGSKGLERAVQWARQAMLDAGLENVRLQPVLVPHWERGAVAELVLTAPPEVAGERLTILALGGSVATPPGGLEAEIVEVRSWHELEELGEAGVAGKLVFYNRPMDAARLDTGAAYGGAVGQRSRGAIEAARRGGLGAIVRSMTTRLDDFPHVGAMRYDESVPKAPGAAVSTRGAERLSALLAQARGAAGGVAGGLPAADGAEDGATDGATRGAPAGAVRARLSLDCRTLPDAPSANVIGEIVGRERPGEVVVIGAHLDGWDVGQGAMDDGGGCCQAIEALRLIRALGLQPRRTIRAVLFTNEENGLRGGEAYHAEHLDEMPGHVLAIESDAGPFTPRAFTTDASPEALSLLRRIGALLAETGLTEVRPGGGGADIGPMRASGVVVMGYEPDQQRYFDLHHSARDTIDQLSPREVNLGAACMAAMAYVVADLEEALPRNAAQATR